jgi:hypothetical protein
MALLNSSSTTSMNGGGAGGPLNSTAYLDNDKTLSSFMMSHHATHTLMNNTPVNSGLLNAGAGHYNNNSNMLGANFQPNSGHSRNNTLSNASIVFTPQIRIKHTGDFLGYLEWKPEDESIIIKRLIDGKFCQLLIIFLCHS